MALVTVQRSPSNSNSSSTISDNECDNEERVKKQCESFFAVKGAALVLPRSTESRPIKKNPIVGELYDHIQSMFLLLRHDDRMTLAVRLESMYEERIRYIILVSCNGVQDTEESIILGVDIMTNSATIGLVLPIWCETSTQLDGDGGFSICSKNRTHTFKPVSVQALWSAMQAIHAGIATGQKYNYYPGGLNLTWVGYYESRINSSPSRVREWQLMPELQVTKPHAFTPTYSEEGHYYPSDRELTEQLIFLKIKDIMASADLDQITSREVRLKLEEDLGKSLRDYRHYLDEQLITYMRQMDSATLIFDHIYLGSEWNASHLEELEANGVGYILNVTMEIDNFYPNRFIYHNVRLYDIESSELLKYWDETYKFLSKAKEKGAKALVHCKMGISRSAATVIAYAMKEYNWPLEKARSFVQRKRKCICPNEGFLQQLQVYEGMLDASRQRHNKLWRSKSESSLASSPECSQETIETASSTEDIAEGTLRISGTTAQTPTSHATITPTSLSPHMSHTRHRSWSPKDSPSETQFPSSTDADKQIGVIDSDFMMLDEDECQGIQIIVPELTPSSPTLSIPTEPVILGQIEETEPTIALPDSEEMDTNISPAQVESLVLGQVASVDSLKVGESPTSSKDAILEMAISSIEPEATDQGVSMCEAPDGSSSGELNTNNNSATGVTLSPHEPIDDAPPPEGTVRLRVTSIENHHLAPDVETSEAKSGEESPSTAENQPVEEEIPVSSGTVQKQKQDIEDRIKAKAAEKGSPPSNRTSKIFTEPLQPASDSTFSEIVDPSSTDPSKLAKSPDSGQSETDPSNAVSPVSSTVGHLQEVATASPTLQTLEKGFVKKITEKLLSHKSPVKDGDEDEQASSPLEKRKSQNFESGSPPPGSPNKQVLFVSKSSPDTCKRILVHEMTEVPQSPSKPGSESGDDITTQASEESVSTSPSKEAYIKTYFGEDIPLEPGTVKRQTIDFEHLLGQGQHEELELKKEAETKKPSPENGSPAQETTQEEEMVVIIRDSSTNGKRKVEEDRSQNKHARLDPNEPTPEKQGKLGEELETQMEEQENSEKNSAYPEEGISSWKVGDVRRHKQQFEELSTVTEMAESSTKANLPKATTDPIEAKYGESVLLSDARDSALTFAVGSGSSSEEEMPEEITSQVDADVAHGSDPNEEMKIKEVEGIRHRIEKLGLVNLRRTASIARISNERGSPVRLRRSDFSRPVTIKMSRPRSETASRSLESSPENASQLTKDDMTVDAGHKSALAGLVKPRPESVPLEFYLEELVSVEIRSLEDSSSTSAVAESPVKADKPSDTAAAAVTSDSPTGIKRKQQHGKSHPLSKLPLMGFL